MHLLKTQQNIVMSYLVIIYRNISNTHIHDFIHYLYSYMANTYIWIITNTPM